MSAPKLATLYRMVMPGHTCPYGLKSLDLLKRKYRRTGGNGTDDRDIGNNIVFPAKNTNSALLERIALDIARLFERIKVRLHG